MHQNATGGAAGDPNVTRAAGNNFPPGITNTLAPPGPTGSPPIAFKRCPYGRAQLPLKAAAAFVWPLIVNAM